MFATHFLRQRRVSFDWSCGKVSSLDSIHVEPTSAIGGGLRSTEEVFLLPTKQPRFESRLRLKNLYCFVCEQNCDQSHLVSAKQWISQMQYAVTSRTKYFKNSCWLKSLSQVSHEQVSLRRFKSI